MQLAERSSFLQKFGLEERYDEALNLRRDGDAESIEKAMAIEAELGDSARDLLVERGLKLPTPLTQDEKVEIVEAELIRTGIDKENAARIVADGVAPERKLEVAIVDDAAVIEVFNNNGVVLHPNPDGSMRAEGKLVVKEGYSVDGTPEKMKFLQDNDITYFKLAENQRKLFVPLKAKKVATLLAASVIMGPIPALLVQIVMNQTGMLDKLLN